jgi:signal transduction histidine kinase
MTNEELNLAMTNLKKAESQLVHAEKMASLGQLTAGIAHEINNPINFVKSNVRPLKMDVDDLLELIKRYQGVSRDNLEEKLAEIDEFTQEIDLPTLHEEIVSLLAGIEEGSSRTADIVKGLRTFSRVDEGELKDVNIHDGLDATLNLLNNVIPPGVSVVKHYGDLPMIECYSGRLNQVFMNILSNAIHAIGARRDTAEEQKITITTEFLGPEVRITIADTGVGIPPEIRSKIFDPFFTTKGVGEGTGLGLSMVFSIVEKHHGKITVNSEVNKGTEFVITLPVSQLTLNPETP